MTDLALVDTETGEYIQVGERSLPELAEDTCVLLDAHDKNEWVIGRNLAEARHRCESADCGIDGDNPDARFGEWVSDNLSDTSIKALFRYRRRFEVFGHRREDVANIPKSAQYLLAAPQCDECREDILSEVANIEKPTVDDVKNAITSATSDVIALKHTGDEESYTPHQYIESARIVMGSIDTDPASNDMAQETVQAGTYYTVDDDGLDQQWAGNVWMNPPYTALVINKFIQKAVDHYVAGDITAAIILCNNNTDTSWFHKCAQAASAVCFTAGRINFLKRDGGKSSPTNGQCFFYLGDNVEKFGAEFGAFGLVMVKQ